MIMSSASYQLITLVQEKTNFQSPKTSQSSNKQAVSGSLRCKANLKSQIPFGLRELKQTGVFIPPSSLCFCQR